MFPSTDAREILTKKPRGRRNICGFPKARRPGNEDLDGLHFLVVVGQNADYDERMLRIVILTSPSLFLSSGHLRPGDFRIHRVAASSAKDFQEAAARAYHAI